MEFFVEKINLNSKRQVNEVTEFLKLFDLKYKDDVDTTLVIRSNDDSIIATASRDKNVFKYFGICKDYQGENLSGKLINELIRISFEEGIYHYFIFTKPQNISVFEGSGFSLIEKNEKSALLESGNKNIKSYLKEVKEKVQELKFKEGNETIATIVMNLNPMTEGHLYLIKYAANKVGKLIVFVVEEDKSAFLYKDRFNIAKEATKDLKNVIVLPSGPYIISRATFPTYFLKEDDNMLEIYTSLDAKIFSKYYCKTLNISKRFVGEEPLDVVTNEYNKSLKKELEKENIDLEVIKRKEENNEVISASRVRKYLVNDELEKVKLLVPNATYKFLTSDDGICVIEKLKEENNNKN